MSKPLRARREWLQLTIGLGATAVFLVVMISSYVFTTRPDIVPAPFASVAEIGDETVAVVAYDRKGSRLPWESMFQGRVAAVDVDTGERVWDARLNDANVSDMRVLAAGAGRVYVATDEGLYIRELEDGAVIAQPDDIAGLTGYVADLGSYDYDNELELVVAQDESGNLFTIALGESAATPASADVRSRWMPIFADGGRVHSTLIQAALGADTLVSRANPFVTDVPDWFIVTEGDTEETLGNTLFFDPEIVIEHQRLTTDGEHGLDYAAGIAPRSRHRGACCVGGRRRRLAEHRRHRDRRRH